jgi:hypothetical protein
MSQFDCLLAQEKTPHDRAHTPIRRSAVVTLRAL